MIISKDYTYQNLVRKKFETFNRHQEIAFKRLSKDTIASSTNVTTHKEPYEKYGIDFLNETKEV